MYTNAQTVDNLFTMVSKINTDIPSTLQLGSFNPNVGFVSNSGIATTQNSVSINGASLNQSTNRFNLVSANFMMSFNLSDGSIYNEIPINSFFNGSNYFTNVKYNSSNNILYGLTSTFSNNVSLDGMYLSKLNTETGDLTQISQNSIGTSYQVSGNAIDPELMVYYFTTEGKFRGLDLYNGTIYSDPVITYTGENDFNFINYTYNCNDQTIYGLVTEDTQILNPDFPFPINIFIMRFGKINPSSGEVSRISQVALPSYVYSVNASSTIDPNTNTFYYSDGAKVYGISLLTGLLVSTATLSYEEGTFINFMTNYNNCLGANATRLEPALTNNDNNFGDKIKIYPNPTSNNLFIDSKESIDSIEVIDSNGRVVLVDLISKTTLNVQNLQNGIYFLKISSNDLVRYLKFVKI